ncbi:MAG: hypothetical protein AAFQ83_19730 [Bacteroidota bacterium]
MKKCMLLILCSIGTLCWGQGKFQIGIMYTPEFVGTTYTIQGPDNSDILGIVREVSGTSIGFTGGLNLRWNVTDRLSLASGLWFSVKKNTSKKLDIPLQVPEPNTPEAFRSVLKLSYVDIPLTASYTLGEGKIKPYISVGAIGHIYRGYEQYSTQYFENGDVTRVPVPLIGEFPAFTASAMLAGGLDVALGSHANLRIGPSFKHMFLKASSDNSSVNFFFYSAGLDAEINFSL